MAVTRTGPLWGVLTVAWLCGTLATTAEAHPHVWITFETTVVYDNGAFVGVRHKWSFDEFYTAMAIEGLDKNKDFAYFTFPALAGKEIKVGEARDYWLEHKDATLSLIFTVPFANPVLMEAKGLTISVYDPTYFIAFDLAKTDPAKLSEGAPKGCEAKVGALAQQPGKDTGLDSLQNQLGALGVSIAKTIRVECNGP